MIASSITKNFRYLSKPNSLTSKRMISSFLSSKLKDPSLLKTKSYINGNWQESSSKSTFPVFDPSTSSILAEVSDATVQDTREAIDAAFVAFQTWGKTTAKERGDYLLELKKLMGDKDVKEDLAKICSAENGKPINDSRGEVDYSASFFEWFSAEGIRLYGDVIPSPIKNQRNIVIRQPLGVAALICPWNFPIAMFARKVAAGLAAGCTVVLKAPEDTPLSAFALVSLCERAGIPPGVVNVVSSRTHMADLGKELCENEKVRKLSFTGSTNVGKLLMKQSSSTLKKLSMELGGNSPFIVFDDADLDEAIKGAITCKFRSSGQTCVCANRIYVHSSIYAEFASRLTSAVEKFKIGGPFDDGVTHGPLIHDRAVEKCVRHVKSAVESGGEVLIGGKKVEREGNFFEPTVISDVGPSWEGLDEETFGPVAALIKFSSESELISEINKSRVGLAGYFYSRDVGRCWRVAEALEVGMVGVNTGLISSAVIPFGGIKESGFGREGSKYGLDDWTSLKYIAMGGIN